MADDRRFDIPATKSRTPGEAFDIRYTVSETQADGTEAEATTFADYSEFECYLFAGLDSGGNTQALRRANAIVYVEAADIDVATPPNALVHFTSEQSSMVEPGADRAHELWAKVGSEWTRLSYGTIPFVH